MGLNSPMMHLPEAVLCAAPGLVMSGRVSATGVGIACSAVATTGMFGTVEVSMAVLTDGGGGSDGDSGVARLV